MLCLNSPSIPMKYSFVFMSTQTKMAHVQHNRVAFHVADKMLYKMDISK